MQENHQKITTELCDKNTLIFFPRDKLQVVFIQECLKKMGVRPAGQVSFNKLDAQRCLDDGIVVLNGEIYTGRQAVPNKAQTPLFCIAGQFNNGDAAETAKKGEDTKYALRKAQALFENMPIAAPDQQNKTTALVKSQGVPGKAVTEAADADDIESGLQRLMNLPREKRELNEELLQEGLKELDDMIGQDQAKRRIRKSIALVRLNMIEEEMGVADDEPPSRHMVFTGDPGTGKTTFAGTLAKIYYALGLIDKPKALDVSREDFVGDVIGATEKKTFKLLEAALGGILFIDEAYSLTTDDSKRDFGIKAVNILNNAAEKLRDNLIIVVAGYPEPMDDFMSSNPGLASRFGAYVPFDTYSMEDLGLIMDKMLEKRGRTMTPEAREFALQLLENDKNEKEAEGKDFGNARIVRNLVEQLKENRAEHMMDAGQLKKDHGGLGDDDYRKEITTYTLADVKEVSLQGIKEAKKAVSPSEITIGFGATLATLRRRKPVLV